MKKLISVLLVACLIANLLPAHAMAAEAEVTYSTDGGTTWKEDSLANAVWGCYSKSGSEIRLKKDITLTDANWTDGMIMAPSNKTLTIDGQGHTITRGSGLNKLFAVSYSNSEVTFKNITIDGGAVWSGNNPATRTNSGISIEGNGNMVVVEGNATVILEQDTILQNSALTGSYADGAAVLVGEPGDGGTLIIKPGAEIRNNYVADGGDMGGIGAAVSIRPSGTVRMEGGKLWNNYAVIGGGAVDNTGTFTMEGGEICNNGVGNNGGGVSIRENGTFTMSGGTITENKAAVGGGVSALSGTFKVSGASVITENTSDSKNADSNIFLDNDMLVKISSKLDKNARFGVTKTKVGVFTSDWTTAMGGTEKPGDYFYSDNPEYCVSKDEKNIEAVLCKHGFGSPAYSWSDDGKSCDVTLTCANDDSHKKKLDMTVTSQVTKPATTTAKGETTYTAKVTFEGTDYVDTKVIADIPIQIVPGTIDKDVEKDSTAPEMQFAMTTESLADIVLTETEKEAKEKGQDIKIILSVEDADSSVSAEDKALTDTVLEGFEVGQYLDISLLKKIGDGAAKPISNTDRKIRIVIDIPDSLRNLDSKKKREFKIIRVHETEAVVLPDMDTDENTITIETDCFSTYALAYHDTATSGGDTPGIGETSSPTATPSVIPTVSPSASPTAKPTVAPEDENNSEDENGGKKDNTAGGKKKKSSDNSEPETGDKTPIEIYATMAMIAGFTYLLLYFCSDKHGMTEEAKKQLVNRIIQWACRGGRVRRGLAKAAIVLLLMYYHSVGKKSMAEDVKASL